jgi:hypothetical protein
MGGMAWTQPYKEPVDRLTDQDTMLIAIAKIAGKNPGALKVCTDMVNLSTEIDPDGLPFGALMILDSLHIYGSRIWLLHKNICQENLVMTMACLRGWQLGIVNQRDLIKAIDNAESDNHAHNLDLPGILFAVRKRLGNFGITELQPESSVPAPSPVPAGRFIDLD